MMTTFEYRVEGFREGQAPFADWLNKIGDEGWELVSLETFMGVEQLTQERYQFSRLVFKRKKSGEVLA